MTDNNTSIHPTKRAGRRVFWIAAIVSSMFSILLLALLFAISNNEPSPLSPVKSKEIIDLLSNSQTSHLGPAEPGSDQVGIALPEGGWVQQTDKHGNLIQQYRCLALDPNPKDLPSGWIKMESPEIELFLSDNRIVRITGDTAIANAPNRILEAGEISGNVRVSMFDLHDGVQMTPNTSPSVVMTTKQVSFDNFIGEITCDHQVKIVSPKQTLVGSQLTVRFNDTEDRIEYLRLEELDYIELIPDSIGSHTSETEYQQPIPILNTQPSKHRIKASVIDTPVEYYIVSLFEHVQINQGTSNSERFAQAEKLTISFSNQRESKKTTLLNTSTPSSMIATGGFPTIIAAVSLSTIQNDSPDLVRITCNGGLTMIPLLDPSLLPTTPEDTRVELFGSIDSPVLLRDELQGMEATGEFLRHNVLKDRSDLYGHPATLLMNDMMTSTEHFWIARQDGKGAAVGEGTMTDKGKNPTGTTLQWSEGVDFTFDSSDGENSGALNKVICHGGVILVSEDSEITCELLDISFVKDGEGSSSPSLAIATGDVKATSDTQVLFADEARVTFTQDATQTPQGDVMFGGSKADTLRATGDVQVVLNDGGRAFCDLLDGHISQDKATLTGNVLIAYERMLMNRGGSAILTLDRVSGKGRWEGPGQALFLEQVIDVLSDERIERPVIQTSDSQAEHYNKVSMRANWKSSMQLDQNFNEGAGSIDLAGNVDVRSSESSLERGQMTGEDLRLEFDYLQVQDKTAPPARELRRVIARNNAQIEHRLWDAKDTTFPPVVYYISGNHIEFDALTREALVVGDGELVLRDLRTPDKNAHQSALAGRGTTRFTWDNKLTTTNITDVLYRIAMSGNVEMVHQGLDSGIGMLTSDSMIAFASDPNPDLSNEDGISELTFRAMDLQQINSVGNVYVATTTRKVDCDAFNYNLLTGIAELTALEGRSVAIVTQGTSYPVRATSITWNMDPDVDTISIHGLQGSTSN